MVRIIYLVGEGQENGNNIWSDIKGWFRKRKTPVDPMAGYDQTVYGDPTLPGGPPINETIKGGDKPKPKDQSFPTQPSASSPPETVE